MNNILLINRVDPRDISENKKNIFFVIGSMDEPSVEDKLIQILNKGNRFNVNDILYKYNGVQLNIKVKEIPEVINLLIENGILVYSVYEMYDPII